MAFFHNRTVNLLNLHTVVSMAALAGGGAFYSAYLLTAGVSVPVVLLANAAIFGVRLVLRSFLLALAVRIGLRRLVSVGALLMAVQFPLVAEVHGLGVALLALVLASAAGDTIYWPSYHAYYASLGDAEHRGQQLGIREAMTAVVGIVSPLAAGWLLVRFGPRLAFAVTALVQALSALPFLWTPDVPVLRRAPGAFRAAFSGIALFIADGWIAAGYMIAWQIALFLALGRDFLAYGGALAIAALVGAVGGVALGRLIDAGKGTRAVWLALGTLAFVVVLRAGVQDHPALAIAANALGSLAGCLYIPTLMTAVYNQAKRSPCPLRFHIAAEAGWDIGIAAGCGSAALLLRLGFSLSAAVLSALFGVATVFVLLRRYYTAHETEAVDRTLLQPEETPNI